MKSVRDDGSVLPKEFRSGFGVGVFELKNTIKVNESQSGKEKKSESQRKSNMNKNI